MTANNDHPTHDDNDDRRDATGQPGGGGEPPRANRGRSTPADSLHTPELKAALAEFNDAYCARGAGEARMLRALSAAYDIALARAHATTSPGRAVPGEDQAFSWHFTSILGEFAIASHDSDTALRNRAHDAHRLVHDFPDWVTAIETGHVDLRHAHALLKHARALEPAHYAAYGHQVLEHATTHTARQTGQFAEREASRIAATAFEAAHDRARAQRHVTITHDGLGMALLTAYLPSELATPIGQLLDKQARALRTANQDAAAEHRRATQAAHAARLTGLTSGASTGDAADSGNGVGTFTATDTAAGEFVPDPRTLAQLRADVFAETLLCATPGASRVTTILNITVPALSLLRGRADGTDPALLDGLIPMSFTEARQLAAHAPTVQRVLTHPVTGQVTHVDSYTPNRALRRYLQVRDRTCQQPGCNRPAMLAEADHTTPYSQGGTTSDCNMAHLCLGHHVQKHEKPWTVTNLGGGRLQWRTPLGQIVTTAPEPPGPRFTPTRAKNDNRRDGGNGGGGGNGGSRDGSDGPGNEPRQWAAPDGTVITLDTNADPDTLHEPLEPENDHAHAHDDDPGHAPHRGQDEAEGPDNSASGPSAPGWWRDDQPPHEGDDEPPPF